MSILLSMIKKIIPAIRKEIIGYIAVIFSIYQLYAILYGKVEPLIHRPIHLAFALALVYLIYPFNKNGKITIYDWILSFASILCIVYLVQSYNRLIWFVGRFNLPDFVVGIVAILLLLEACRRVIGVPLLLVVATFILYGIYGKYFPGFLAHQGFSSFNVIFRLFFTSEGIFGIPIGAASTYIFLFVMFGTLLEFAGTANYFLELSTILAGSATGGPAKIAVISSLLFGSISGSSIANVMTTGSFTIPMMKELGYNTEFAGATEAAASTGGQLMPPIMGAAAFLIAEFLGISYWTVVKAAIIPALLYFLGVYFSVHFEAKKMKLKGLSINKIPSRKGVLKKIYLLTPLFVIVVALASGRTSISRTAIYGIVSCLIVGIINPDSKINFKNLIIVLKNTAFNALSISVATATAGIIVGIVTLTGLGIKFGEGVIRLSGGNLIVTLLFVALTSLVLGMGVPTAPNFIITYMVAAPALIKLGITPLAASLFVFYFGIISDVTPPVCLAVFAACSISGVQNIMGTAMRAFKSAIGGFLAPFVFVLSPSLLLIKVVPIKLLIDGISAVIGIIAISSSFAGYFKNKLHYSARFFLFIGGLLTIFPGYLNAIFGAAIIIITITLQPYILNKGFYGDEKIV